jgi:hypothetical protein
MQNNTSLHIIPDISYQLSFCFLPFKDLFCILKCCKKWNRILKESFFINLYKSDEMYHLKKAKHAHVSPFHDIVKHVKVEFHSESLISLVHFSHLASLSIYDSTEWKNYATYNIETAFKTMAPNLRDLKIELIRPPTNLRLIGDFMDALKSLNGLTSLHLAVNMAVFLDDVSFLYRMKSLKSLVIKHILETHLIELVPAIRSLQCLCNLNLDCSRFLLLDIFRPLCIAPNNLTNLKEITFDWNIYKITLWRNQKGIYQ